jgi:AcrR family transcriptional regulator
MTSEKLIDIKGIHAPKTKHGMTKIQLLLESAEKLFSQSSFFEVSVSDICKEAHTAVGTFYIYFDSKTDVYRYLVEHYRQQIKRLLAQAIAGCSTRAEMEREGIKCFVRYAVENPNVYNIIWGSLAVEREMFENYYVSFAESYARALTRAQDELKVTDVTTMAYMLMGITNFLGLRAMFEQMTPEQIDAAVDLAIMPILEKGMFR